MSSFTTIIDGSDHWQVKSGFDDDMLRLRVGDAVPYRKNEDLAMDIQWPDDVLEAHNAHFEDARQAYVIIKDHVVHSVVHILPNNANETALRLTLGIWPPKLQDWSDEAKIAYHRKEIQRLQEWIQRRDQIGRECGDMEWYKKPGAYMRLKIRESSLMSQILPSTQQKSSEGSGNCADKKESQT